MRSAPRSSGSRLDYDLVVVDTPGRLSLLTVATLAAADHVVVPVPAGAMELEHLDTLDDSIEQVRSLNPSLNLLAIVPCGVDTRMILARDVLAALEGRYPALVTATGLRRTVRAAEAFAHRQPLTRFEPDHPIAADLQDLAREIERRLTRCPHDAPRPAVHPAAHAARQRPNSWPLTTKADRNVKHPHLVAQRSGYPSTSTPTSSTNSRTPWSTPSTVADPASPRSRSSRPDCAEPLEDLAADLGVEDFPNRGDNTPKPGRRPAP